MTIYRELTCSHYDGLVAENERLRTVYDAAVAFADWDRGGPRKDTDSDGSKYDAEWCRRQDRLFDAVEAVKKLQAASSGGKEDQL